MEVSKESLDLLCINTIRTLSIDAVQKANSGHPGLPLGAAPMAYVVWQNHLRHNPKDPDWPNRDRFVLSAGHGSMLLYSMLYLTGYDVTMDDIESFRQWESRTPGHPEMYMTPGVEATTGPLGQGTANAVGMAIAERFLAGFFNRPGHEIVDHYTYALVSDGDLMEGIAAEACSLAGHLKLGKLIFLYDSNDVSLDGPTSLTFSTEDVIKRFKAYGWHAQLVEKGDTDTAAIDRAIKRARRDTSRPSIIVIKTTIGYGSPNKQGTADAHGSPLGVDEVALTKKALGWDPEKHFFIPEDALAHFRKAVSRGKRLESKWRKLFDAWSREFPDLAGQWELATAGELPDGWDKDVPTWKPGDDLATRKASGQVLNAIAARLPWLIGGDADLSVSTNTAIKGDESFDGQSGRGRNLHFGVREHAMAGITNGMAYHGGLLPYSATFFVFSDYMRPSVRLAAMNRLHVIYVWTHDSIGVGEDGPTHQPVEHVMVHRAIPNLTVIRPADANETAEAWRWAAQHKGGPVALVLSRQKLPTLDRERFSPASGLRRGAYVLSDPAAGEPQAIIIATGSEVQVALAAQELLAKDGVRARVVSMPCWEIFEAESREYQESVLLSSITARVSVEAGVTLGWSRWTGDKGISIGVDRFGASAPGKVVMEMYGITSQRVAQAVKDSLQG